MAQAMPCIKRAAMSKLPEGARAHAIEANENRTIPVMRTFLRPNKSPALAKGIWSVADANRNAVTIQVSAIAFISNSWDILGNARLMEEVVKGTSEADRHITASTE